MHALLSLPAASIYHYQAAYDARVCGLVHASIFYAEAPEIARLLALGRAVSPPRR